MILLVVAVLLALVRCFLVQAFVVPTDSMAPTIAVGDRLLVSRLAYRIGAIHRGDIVVFDGSGVFAPPSPPARSALARLGRSIAAAFGMPIGSQDFVKRVVGLPGERIACCDTQHRITVDGAALSEPYLPAGEAASTVGFDIVVPPGRLWVLGDHRSDSADSRSHLGDPGGGTVPQDRVVGKVMGIFWPMSHAGATASPAGGTASHDGGTASADGGTGRSLQASAGKASNGKDQR